MGWSNWCFWASFRVQRLRVHSSCDWPHKQSGCRRMSPTHTDSWRAFRRFFCSEGIPFPVSVKTDVVSVPQVSGLGFGFLASTILPFKGFHFIPPASDWRLSFLKQGWSSGAEKREDLFWALILHSHLFLLSCYKHLAAAPPSHAMQRPITLIMWNALIWVCCESLR